MAPAYAPVVKERLRSADRHFRSRGGDRRRRCAAPAGGRDAEAPAGADVGGGGAKQQRDLTRLDPPAAGIPDRHLLGTKREADALRLPGRQRNTPETAQ